MENKHPNDIAADFLRQTRDVIDVLGVPLRFADAVDAVLRCTGIIVTTGLGKAGHAAKKCSSSFCSMGFLSCFLHPAEASHGDVGVITPRDMLVAFSTSGKTREVLETIELARSLGVSCVVAVTSHSESPVRAASDIVLEMGIMPEAGHIGLAPTTSIVIMLIIADMLATTCASVRGVTKDEFGLRHHGGYLGRKCRGEEP